MLQRKKQFLTLMQHALTLSVIPMVLLFSFDGVMSAFALPKVWAVAVLLFLSTCFGLAAKSKMAGITKEGAALVGSGAALVLLSTVTSRATLVSFLGINGQEYTSILWVFLLIIFGFQLKIVIDSRKDTASKTLVTMALLAFVLLATIGLAVSQEILFVDSVLTIGLGAVLLIVLSVDYLNEQSLKMKVFGAIGLLAGIVALLVLGIASLWLLLGVGLVLWIAHLAYHKKLNTGFSSSVLIGMLALSMIFGLFGSPFKSNYPNEIYLTSSASHEVAKAVLTSSEVLFGTGPGTYSLAYLNYRPESINASEFAGLSIDRAKSGLITLLITFGAIPTLFLIASFIFIVLRSIHSSKHAKESPGLLIGLILLFTSLLILPLSLTWSVLCVAVITLLPKKAVAPVSFNLLKTVCVGAALLLVVCILTLRMTSEIAFVSAVQAQALQDVDRTRQQIDSATALFPLNDSMFRNLSYALLVSASSELQKESPDDDLAARYLALSIDAAQKATNLVKHHPANWASLGQVYSELTVVDPAANALAINAFKEASLLAPSVAIYQVELGKLQYSEALRLERLETPNSELLMEASASFASARELQSKDTSIGYYLAQISQKLSGIDAAITSLSESIELSPDSPNLLVELGILELEADKIEKAKASLLKAISINPEHSNARWYLASALESLGDLDAALEQLHIVERLNPKNTLVLERIANLESLKPVFGPELVLPLEDVTGEAPVQ